MVDEMNRLRSVERLCELLQHYAEVAMPDRQAWQDRIAELSGAGPREMVQLYGELLAYGWLEQNTGLISAASGGSVPACYRITLAGIRALRNFAEIPADAV
jgi:hypothetical protein